jgi:threonine aldolase
MRSDTVTHPTEAMRAAMADAPVGDDVFGDDPTVTALEHRAAAMLDKEAALFVPSGTMGNLVSLMAHVPRGGEVIAPAESHVFNDEAANYAVVVAAGLRPIAETPDGEMPLDAVVGAIQDSSDPHCPITSLVVVENCHAHTMSRPITPDYMQALRASLPEHLPIHVDGARLFNAAVALGVPAAELVRDAASVTFCLSKGLSAPVGSVVVGSTDFVWRARRARKLLGGGMRQAGVLAAAGLVALSDGDDGTVARLADDHAMARRLAEGLALVAAGEGRAQRHRDPLTDEGIAPQQVVFTRKEVHGAAPALAAASGLAEELAHHLARRHTAAQGVDVIAIGAAEPIMLETHGLDHPCADGLLAVVEVHEAEHLAAVVHLRALIFEAPTQLHVAVEHQAHLTGDLGRLARIQRLVTRGMATSRLGHRGRSLGGGIRGGLGGGHLLGHG